MGVKVHLQGDGLNYETEATVIQAAKIIGFLNTEEPLNDTYGPSRRIDDSASTNFIEDKPFKQVSSPREAILNSSAKTNAQKILVLGQYITERDGTDEFAPNELKTLFVKAGEPAPSNLTRDIREAVRSGFITESIETTGVFVVTNTGRKALADSFTRDTSQNPRRRKTSTNGKTASSKKRTIPQWINDLPSISDQLADYPSYRKMNKRGDKVIWILEWASQQGRDHVSGAEIELIAEKLADSIPNKQVAATISAYLSKGLVSKNSEGYRILHNGSEYLRSFEASNE